ncbi:hypothetical protein BXZ70DRAFT_891549 [Cristinia sonorae]|uniref:Uncharacterized protein n=1 Tax=Cristinia sonorae TaxID=1940300 RepID=A0A8K0UR41_9AGAR|nr:hypothetical protein BXZ70DRAFT_891447 [Cristinia sonorae]KAH8101613.1 hypothetical protein BXZ70DRAFT_891549 [Cristinia sonorae]
MLPPLGRQRVEDAIRQPVHIQHFPLDSAGKPIQQGSTVFDSYGTDASNPYAPFSSKMDWEIARWSKLLGPGSNCLDRLLSIEGLPEALGLSFTNVRHLNQIVDQLPTGRPRFRCKEINVAGETYEVYYRDALECIKSLYGDPNFAGDLIFKPERHYTDADRTLRMYHDMHTGTWWWDLQKDLEKETPGATIIPVIISTDKTRLTTFKGKTAYPVYMTIGNIPKDIRRKPSLGSQILLAYLPTARLEHITNKSARRRTAANLFHACMRKILERLKDAGNNGVAMASGDGVVRRCHPIFAAHVGDYPEQVLVTGVNYRKCPCCPADLDDHSHADGPFRDLNAVLDALETVDLLARKQACKAAGIKPIFQPYWQDLPYADPFLSITPDILHQLYQGVIKHLVAWIKTAFSQTEIDARCRSLPRNHHVRVFTKGITSLYQLTGREHADIARILLGLVADMPLPDGMSPVRLVRCVRAILDFLYLSQYPVHTSETLMLLRDALTRFHDNKQVFVDLGVRDDFEIPKLHFLDHWAYLIRRLGSPDNFNTEYTERLHIDLAKDAYEATNGKDEFPQMTLWLERHEKLVRHERYVSWCLAGRPPLQSLTHLAHKPPPDRVKMTKHPSKKAVPLETLQTEYGAPLFKNALAQYAVKCCHPNYSTRQVENAAVNVPFTFSSVPVYHKAKFWLGDLHNHRLSSDEWDVLHATPARRDKRGRHVDGQFDTAMVKMTNDAGYTGVQGYLVGQVKVIFSLPKQALQHMFVGAVHQPPQYLAYVEWFTKFTTPHSVHGMYTIKRSLNDRGDRHASVISLRAIRRSTYLFPVFGPTVPAGWTSGNVLDRCSKFYVDPFSDRHAYHTIH